MVDYSEQLAPIFGLTKLMRAADLETTLQKLAFVIEHVWEHANQLTTIVSLFSLSMLVTLRWFKGQFQKTWWIYRLPEVLIVVGLSTCRFHSSPLGRSLMKDPQSYLVNSGGIRAESTSWVLSRCQLARTL
jgi:MFS superfamily sulfate permease-like transporter